jgi:hypothetical protein
VGGVTLWGVLVDLSRPVLDSLTEGASCGCVAVSQDVGKKRSRAPTASSEACKGVAGADLERKGFVSKNNLLNDSVSP